MFFGAEMCRIWYIYIHDYIYIYIIIYYILYIYRHDYIYIHKIVGSCKFKVSVSRSKQRPFSVEETNNMAQKVTKCDQLGATLEEEF